MVGKHTVPSERIAELAEQITDYLLQEEKKRQSWKHGRVLYNDTGGSADDYERYKRRQIRRSPEALILAMTAYLDEQAGTSYDYTKGEGLKW